VKNACEQITSKQLKQLEKYVLLAEKLAKSESSKFDGLKLLEIDYQFHLYPETVDLSGGENAIAILYPQEL